MRMSACGLVLMLGFVPALSMAQVPPPDSPNGSDPGADGRARELYEKGDRFYSEGRYEKSIEAFREAYTLSRRPLLLFNLANAYERLGRYDEAVAALREYQPSAAEGDRDAVAKRIDSLELRAREQAGQAKPAPPQPAAQSPNNLVQPAPTEGDAAPQPSSSPIGGYVLVGVGVAILGTATAFAVVASRAKSEAKDQCPTGICPAEAEETIDRERTYAALADIGFGVGAVAVGAGVLAIILHEPDRNRQSARVAVSPSLHGAEVSLVGRF
ncbi:MAG: tetratricopeptide repeat protein [Polyangiaceae bacterium]